jgi:hypothetical protein
MARVGAQLPALPARESVVAARAALRRFVLWSALVFAVGVLATIAWRLMRQPGPQ